MQAQVSLRRLCRFLSSEDTDPSWITCITETQNVDETQNVETIQHAVTSISGSYPSLHRNNEDMPEIAIMVENADFTWCHSQEIEPSITLSDISLCIPKGSLVAILGKARFPPFDFCLQYCSISMIWGFSSCWCHFLISYLLHLWWWCDQHFWVGYLIKSSHVGIFILEVTSSVNVNKIYLKFHSLFYDKPGRGRKIVIVGRHFGRDALCTRQSSHGWICCLCNPGIYCATHSLCPNFWLLEIIPAEYWFQTSMGHDSLHLQRLDLYSKFFHELGKLKDLKKRDIPLGRLARWH